MWTAIPDSMFHWEFTLVDDAGVTRGDLKISGWRQQGTVTVGDTAYAVTKAGPYLFSKDGDVIARAEKQAPLDRRLLVTSDGQSYLLRRRSVGDRTMVLHAAGNEETEIGVIAPEGALTGRYRIALEASVPLPVRGFVIWLALLSSKIEFDHLAVAAGIA